MFNDEQEKFMSELWMRIYAASIMSEDYDHVKRPESYADEAVKDFKRNYHAGLFKI